MAENEKNRKEETNVFETDEKNQEPVEYGPINLIDDELPDLIGKQNQTSLTLKTDSFALKHCKNAKKVDLASFTSTWLSVSAKDIDIRHSMYHIIPVTPEGFHRIHNMDDDDFPYCDKVTTSLLIPDHLQGIKMRHNLHIASESGLKETLLGNNDKRNN